MARKRSKVTIEHRIILTTFVGLTAPRATEIGRRRVTSYQPNMSLAF